MAATVTYIHVNASGSGRLSPASVSFDEEEYEQGDFTLDEVVAAYVNDGYSSIIIEIRSEDK